MDYSAMIHSGTPCTFLAAATLATRRLAGMPEAARTAMATVPGAWGPKA